MGSEMCIRDSPCWVLVNLLGCAKPKQQIRQCKPGRIVDPFLLGATFAEIHLLHFTLDDLRQENSGLLGFANIAEHWSNSGSFRPGYFAESCDKTARDGAWLAIADRTAV